MNSSFLFVSNFIVIWCWLLTLLIRDDVADHEKWSDQLGCERILHLQDVWKIPLFYLLMKCGKMYEVKSNDIIIIMLIGKLRWLKNNSQRCKPACFKTERIMVKKILYLFNLVQSFGFHLLVLFSVQLDLAMANCRFITFKLVVKVGINKAVLKNRIVIFSPIFWCLACNLQPCNCQQHHQTVICWTFPLSCFFRVLSCLVNRWF